MIVTLGDLTLDILVKPDKAHAAHPNSPGSVTMSNSSLSSCIEWAYSVGPFQITGPGWLNSARFNIAAKAAESVTDDQLKLMMRSLLADRFKLEVHREEKVMTVYELVVAKSGHKMKVSETEGELSFNGTPGKPVAAVQRVAIAQMVEILSRAMRAPVIDKTGLTGKYDFTVDFSGYISKDMREDDVPALAMSALPELLGLKLESKKSPVEMLIVDHMEKVPTEN